MRFVFDTGSDRMDVQVRRDGRDWRLVVDDREVPFRADRGPAGDWRVQTPQGVRRLWVVARGDDRFVFCDGRTFTFRRVDPHQEPTDDPTGGGGLVAAMPGKVVRVLVAVGDQVERGRSLVILESMKMETELVAPAAGTVVGVPVTDGQQVAQGDALVVIEPAGEDS